jgi:hypothetical protein
VSRSTREIALDASLKQQIKQFAHGHFLVCRIARHSLDSIVNACIGSGFELTVGVESAEFAYQIGNVRLSASDVRRRHGHYSNRYQAELGDIRIPDAST